MYSQYVEASFENYLFKNNAHVTASGVHGHKSAISIVWRLLTTQKQHKKSTKSDWWNLKFVISIRLTM